METQLSRDFTATAFVVWQSKVLLHKHRKLDRWLPPGGHIDASELPDEAAVREVLEESGVAVELVGEADLSVTAPRQLIRPRGVQLESIYPGHEHIDLIYFARPVEPYTGFLLPEELSLGWYSAADLADMDLTDEIVQWTGLALLELTPKDVPA